VLEPFDAQRLVARHHVALDARLHLDEGAVIDGARLLQRLGEGEAGLRRVALGQHLAAAHREADRGRRLDGQWLRRRGFGGESRHGPGDENGEDTRQGTLHDREGLPTPVDFGPQGRT
jgi:hypothetical protein